MCVGFNRRSLKGDLHQKQLLDAKHEGKHWVKRDRKIRKDVVFEDVVKWYFEETKINSLTIELHTKPGKHMLHISFKRMKQDVNFPLVHIFRFHFTLISTISVFILSSCSNI